MCNYQVWWFLYLGSFFWFCDLRPLSRQKWCRSWWWMSLLKPGVIEQLSTQTETLSCVPFHRYQLLCSCYNSSVWLRMALHITNLASMQVEVHGETGSMKLNSARWILEAGVTRPVTLHTETSVLPVCVSRVSLQTRYIRCGLGRTRQGDMVHGQKDSVQLHLKTVSQKKKKRIVWLHRYVHCRWLQIGSMWFSGQTLDTSLVWFPTVSVHLMCRSVGQTSFPRSSTRDFWTQPWGTSWKIPMLQYWFYE